MSEGILRLTKTEFKKVEALFTTLDEHLAIHSILDGLSPAEIYVDDKESPKQQLLGSNDVYSWQEIRASLL